MAASPSDALRRACAHRRLEMSTTVMQEVFGTTPCEQQKEVMSEAKGRGYDTAVIRKLIALRKRYSYDIAEDDAVMEVYKETLGM